MIFHAARRIADGILTGAAGSPNTPDAATVVANAVSQLGGVAGDWEYAALSEAQFLAVMAALPARSKLVVGVVTSAAPLDLNLSNDEVAADGVAIITLTVDCLGGDYSGLVNIRITSPTGEVTADFDNAVAGVAEFEISTPIVGTHRIEVETVLHGVAFVNFKGV